MIKTQYIKTFAGTLDLETVPKYVVPKPKGFKSDKRFKANVPFQNTTGKIINMIVNGLGGGAQTGHWTLILNINGVDIRYPSYSKNGRPTTGTGVFALLPGATLIIKPDRNASRLQVYVYK